eukprot:jgi/Hompol1/5742/HPOL_004666-RA
MSVLKLTVDKPVVAPGERFNVVCTLHNSEVIMGTRLTVVLQRTSELTYGYSKNMMGSEGMPPTAGAQAALKDVVGLQGVVLWRCGRTGGKALHPKPRRFEAQLVMPLDAVASVAVRPEMRMGYEKCGVTYSLVAELLTPDDLGLGSGTGTGIGDSASAGTGGTGTGTGGMSNPSIRANARIRGVCAVTVVRPLPPARFNPPLRLPLVPLSPVALAAGLAVDVAASLDRTVHRIGDSIAIVFAVANSDKRAIASIAVSLVEHRNAWLQQDEQDRTVSIASYAYSHPIKQGCSAQFPVYLRIPKDAPMLPSCISPVVQIEHYILIQILFSGVLSTKHSLRIPLEFVGPQL